MTQQGWLAQIHGEICSEAGEGTWFLVSQINILIPNPPFSSHSHEWTPSTGISAVIACHTEPLNTEGHTTASCGRHRAASGTLGSVVEEGVPQETTASWEQID